MVDRFHDLSVSVGKYYSQSCVSQNERKNNVPEQIALFTLTDSDMDSNSATLTSALAIFQCSCQYWRI